MTRYSASRGMLYSAPPKTAEEEGEADTVAEADAAERSPADD